MTRATDKPLKVSLTKDSVVIEFGFECNAFAFEESEWNNPWNDEKQNWIRLFKVTDPVCFSKEVARQIIKEREDGSTPLSDFLDKMCIAAVEDGSEGIEYPL